MARGDSIHFDEKDWQTFRGLCGILATQEEIVSVMNVPRHTIERNCREQFDCTFGELHKTLMDGGKASIRRHQMKLCEHSAAMAIWLGKIHLGQRDKEQEDRDNEKHLGILGHIKKIILKDGDEL